MKGATLLKLRFTATLLAALGLTLRAAHLLAFVVRGQPALRLTLLGALRLVLSLALWGVLLAPVNAEWLQAMESAPESVPELYLRLRPRWEYGHLSAFGAWLIGFGLLLLSVINAAPTERPRNPAA